MLDFIKIYIKRQALSSCGQFIYFQHFYFKIIQSTMNAYDQHCDVQKTDNVKGAKSIPRAQCLKPIKKRSLYSFKRPFIQDSDKYGWEHHESVGVIRAIWINKLTQKIQSIYYGTAFLLSSKILLTCSHNIYNEARRELAHQVTFIPNPNSSLTTEHIQNVNIKFLPLGLDQTFLDDRTLNEICLIRLSNSVYSSKYIKLGYEINLKGKEAYIIGYTSKRFQKNDKLQTTKFSRKCLQGKILNNEGDTIKYTMNTKFGHGGSPILTRIGEQIVAIGIHTHYGKADKNKGIYFNCEALEIIMEHLEQLQRLSHQNFCISIKNFNELEFTVEQEEQFQVQYKNIECTFKKQQQKIGRVIRISKEVCQQYQDQFQ